MSKSLFEINQQYLMLLDNIEEMEGEITPEIEQALQINKTDAVQKATNYIAIIKRLEAEAEMYDTYKKQAETLKKRAENKISYLKASLLNGVNVFGEIQTELFKIGLRKSESVEISDINLIPNDFATFEKKVDKTAIKKAIKENKEVPGASIVTKNNLSIK